MNNHYPERIYRTGDIAIINSRNAVSYTHLHYHPDALHLNTGRNCFEYILRAKGYKKVYIPYYTCEVMLEPLRKCGVTWEFYHIKEDFEPLT